MKKRFLIIQSILLMLIASTWVQAKITRAQEVIQKEAVIATPAVAITKKEAKKTQNVLDKTAHEEDKIVATIYPSTEGKAILITKRDCQRLSIQGHKQTLEELVYKNIMFDQAKYKYKMDVSLDRAEKQIEEIMRYNHLTRDQIKAMFKQSGYTYEQALQELTMNGSIEQLLHHKIKSRIIINDADIEKYYKNNPEHVNALYTVSVGFIAQDAISQQDQEHWNAIKDSFDQITWSDEIALAGDDIAQERAYITKMDKGEIANLEEIEGGFEVIKLVEKDEARLKTLEESRNGIASLLRQKQFEKELQTYKQALMKEYEVVYHA